MRNRLAFALALIVVLALAALLPAAYARRSAEALAEVSLRELPGEAREVLVLIHAGGPFRYERDGVVFGNREHSLPGRPRGYYHEYTVPTPGAHTRAARRIVCGGPRERPEVCYYTDDHYRSFRRILE
jgi:ribonuclease T1